MSRGTRTFNIYRYDPDKDAAPYMQTFKLESILKKLHIDEKVIFYGVEDIETNNFFWHIFAVIKKVTPTFVSFYKMPAHKIHGVVTQIKL